MTGLTRFHPPTQKILALELPFVPSLSDVTIGDNAAVLNAAGLWIAPPASTPNNHASVLTWGAQGSGKTLLAHALTQACGAAYLHPASTSHAFAHAHDALCVVVDDIDRFDDTRATAAFDIFNRLRALPDGRWWATSRVPPALMSQLRADISSRMGWGLVFELHPLNDEDAGLVLQAQARRLGFSLTQDTAQYLLLRLERNLSVLTQHLAHLNHYALTLKKPVNNYLVQQWYTQVYLPNLQTELP
jgi:DnaA-homolog protein